MEFASWEVAMVERFHKLLTCALAALGAVAMATGAQAEVISDNFDAENGGVPAAPYDGFANFNTTGPVDLVQGGACMGGTGSCVVLNGSTSYQTGVFLELKNEIAFGYRDLFVVSFDLSRNEASQFDHTIAVRLLFDRPILTAYYPCFTGCDPYIYTNDYVDLGYNVFPTSGFTRYEFRFGTLDSGSATVRIGAYGVDGAGPIIDNVTIERRPGVFLPEPSSWALMLLGFGAAGANLRRRTAAQRAAGSA